jgi:class 3 adenylate cyclase/pimeloyl-ACP methyl ester carboxylesterase
MPTSERPQTRYVAVEGADVAYQVFGDGPLDLVFFSGIGSHVEFYWDWAGAFLQRLASFSRVVLFDRRGTGASDAVPLSAIPTWEEATLDLQAVLDAVGSERAAIYAEADAGPIAILFAATHPDRVTALVLGNTSARLVADGDYEIGGSVAEVQSLLDLLGSQWGTPELVKMVAPELASDRDLVELLARSWRSALTPRAAAALWRTLLDVDVRNVLPLVQAPTLVLHNAEGVVPFSHGEYLADHIVGAQIRERPGNGSGFIPASHSSTAETVAEFLTGASAPDSFDRVLTTILFTDIVGSTTKLAEIGDEKWRRLLDQHDRRVREQLRLHRGHEVNTTGDGFVVSFDGPARAIRCAQAIGEALSTLGIDVRAGLHSGECEVRGDDMTGLAVHIAARVSAMAGSGEILVSGTVKDLVAGSGIQFDERGENELAGVPGTWKLFAAKA